MFSLLTGQDSHDKVYDQHLQNRLNDLFFGTKNEEEYLNEIGKEDKTVILKLLEEVHREIKFINMENIVMETFLKKNDPKMLIGLEMTEDDNLKGKQHQPAVQFAYKIQNVKKFKRSSLTESPDSETHQSVSLKRSGATSQSLVDRTIKLKDVRLNYKTRIIITDKHIIDMKNRIKDNEKKGYAEMRRLQTIYEEHKYTLNEGEETYKTFNKNVVVLGMDPHSGLISAEKFLRFCRNWIHAGMALMSSMRISSNNILHHIHQLRNVLVRKSEMSGVLGPIDFEQLQIKKIGDEVVLEEKIASLNFMKTFGGKASYVLTVQRRNLMDIESKLKTIVKKAADTRKHILRLEQESIQVEQEIDISEEHNSRLENKMMIYEAPRITDYILQKDKLTSLEKEKKLILHKMYLLKIRLKNVLQKWNQRNANKLF